jgi:hypothetical protein
MRPEWGEADKRARLDEASSDEDDDEDESE